MTPERTAVPRVIFAFVTARNKDNGKDWKSISPDLQRMGKAYVKVRNFLEHLDKVIANSTPAGDVDCSFTPEAILTCKEKGETFTFDFCKDALAKPQQLYGKVFTMLTIRKGDRENEA